MSTRAADNMQEKHASAGVAMSLATLSMAAASGLQALLYLNSFGVDGRTDGFFVAFALYTIVGVFSQSIRMTSANLLIGDRPRLLTAEYGACLGLIAIPMLILTIPLADQFAHLLAPGLDAADRAVTADALPLLGLAAALQLWAAGGATLLAVRDRFNSIAAAYIFGAALGLVVYVAVAPLADELVLGWSMLAMAVGTLAVMLVGLRGARPEPARAASKPSFAPARLVSMSGLILARTAIYLVFNALYMVTLAFAGGYAEGDATVLSYAYLFASYLVAGTAFALGLSRIADMRRGVLGEWRQMLTDTVPSGFRYSMLIVAPAMAALIVAGAPLIGELLPHSFDAGDVETLRVFAALLAPWAVAALLVNLLLPALLALGHGRLVNALAPPLLILHIGVTALGGALLGSDGVVGAAFIAPAAFAAVLFFVGVREGRWALARTLAGDGGRLSAFAAASFGGAAALAALLADGLAEALLAGALGCALYAGCLLLAVPRLVGVLLGAIRKAPSVDQAAEAPRPASSSISAR
jgi:peptidoglycan biosynthesis protein MviN/MurJ (putative lipid II flippase)